MDITNNTIIKLDSYLKKELSQRRYIHSVSTAETAAEMCSRFGVNKLKGYTAGLIHDMAREINLENLITLSWRYGDKISDYEIKAPVILHGRAGAVMAEELFCIKDKEIREAVAYHTTGRPGMCTLAKIVFISDYIEPLRKHITADYIKKLRGKSLDYMLKTVLTSVLEHTYKEYENASEASIQLLEELS